jgi:hypothetical protein
LNGVLDLVVGTAGGWVEAVSIPESAHPRELLVKKGPETSHLLWSRHFLASINALHPLSTEIYTRHCGKPDGGDPISSELKCGPPPCLVIVTTEGAHFMVHDSAVVAEKVSKVAKVVAELALLRSKLTLQGSES